MTLIEQQNEKLVSMLKDLAELYKMPASDPYLHPMWRGVHDLIEEVELLKSPKLVLIVQTKDVLGRWVTRSWHQGANARTDASLEVHRHDACGRLARVRPAATKQLSPT